VGIDYRQYASKLVVKPVWDKSPANDTGYLTPPQLYTPYQPFTATRQLIHATVGRNTLPYFAAKVDANWHVLEQAGSINDGRQVCAHQLIPKDDYTIYDMVPEGYGCGHCNPGILKGQSSLNYHARGYEVENLQNGDGGDPFTEGQYIKLALTIAYHAAVDKTRNIHIGSHLDASFGAIVANQLLPGNAHRDPDAGPFDWSVFYGHLFMIRQPEAGVFDYWGMAPYDGR
jgi:N-acetyl-anhydromuramyl-L-alanine amidase AmpD